jgi:hypothetical protein
MYRIIVKIELNNVQIESMHLEQFLVHEKWLKMIDFCISWPIQTMIGRDMNPG